MKKNLFFKNFLPLIIAFLGALIFFTSYNRYLLDSSMVNLKISLRELGGAKTLAEVKAIKSLLDAAFLMEITKDDFDLALALKMEIASQMVEEVALEKQEKNERYVVSMTSAAEIDAVSAMAVTIFKPAQIEDAKHFIKEVIAEKSKRKPFLISKLEDFIIALTPSKERGELRNFKKIIEKKKKNLASYRGEKLQREYLKIARLYLRIKNYANSLVYINKTIAVDHRNPLALTAKFYLGILYKARKDFKKAYAVFSEIKKELPDEWEGFASYQEADSLYALGETQKAIALFEKNFDKNPFQETRQLSQFRAGYIYLYDLEDLAAANAAFSKLQKKARGSRFADYYMKKIKPDLATYYAYKGFKLLKEGYKTSNSEKYTEALRQFDLALEVFSNLDLAYSGKALAYNLLNQSTEALVEVEKAKQFSSRSAEAAIVLGSIYYNLGIIDKAIFEYETARKLNFNLDILHYNLGTGYLSNKNYSKAKAFFKRAIKVNPNFAEAYNNLGYIFWLEGSYRKSERFFKKAIALNPGYIEPIYNWGVVLTALGKYETARKTFGKVQGLQVGYRKTKYYLDRIKKQLGY